MSAKSKKGMVFIPVQRDSVNRAILEVWRRMRKQGILQEINILK